MSGTTQALKPCAANPPGAGLVTRRRVVQVSWTENRNSKFHNDLTLLSETRTVGHLLPQFTPDVTAGWADSPVDTRSLGPHSTAG